MVFLSTQTTFYQTSFTSLICINDITLPSGPDRLWLMKEVYSSFSITHSNGYPLERAYSTTCAVLVSAISKV